MTTASKEPLAYRPGVDKEAMMAYAARLAERGLSFRDMSAALLRVFGVRVTHETIRRWDAKGYRADPVPLEVVPDPSAAEQARIDALAHRCGQCLGVTPAPVCRHCGAALRATA